ncbi:hypothetical protein MNBD_NITROSPINAE04-1126 [hydrothermal vent metagenome]|uniref:HAMP domain-containing protein n=1 Tax=hydrothermal vent metagenome TaxID=652676 RepID=A0A3B1BWY0_9ZZZZ
MVDRNASNVDERIISKPFGVVYLSRITIAVVAGAALSIFLIYFLLNRDLSGGYFEAISGIGQAGTALLRSVFYSVLFQLIIALSVIALVVIYYSDKILGPLYRVTVTFLEIAGGDIRSETRIRGKDELQSIPGRINGLKSELAAFVDEIQEKCDTVSSDISSLEGASEGDKVELEKKLREDVEKLNEITKRIKFGD